MHCPCCGAPTREIRVLETTNAKDQIRRRRECGLCNQRFSTVEVVIRDRQRTKARDLVVMPPGSKDALTKAFR